MYQQQRQTTVARRSGEPEKGRDRPATPGKSRKGKAEKGGTRIPLYGLSRLAMAAMTMLTLAGCAAIPNLAPDSKIKEADAYQSKVTLSAPAATWPAANWWHRYGDEQLNGLIDEALRDSPTLAIAQARLEAARGMTQIADAPLKPQVTGQAGILEGKLTNEFLTPKAFVPQGTNDYGVAALNLSWELDFWGKNRAALAAATSEQKASEVELDEARLMLSAAVAQQYAELAHLYARRDTAEGAVRVRSQTTSLMRQRHDQALENLATVREAEANQAAAEADLKATDERIALQKNKLAALLGAGPDRGLAIERPSARIAGNFGLPSNVALDLIGRRPDIVAARLRTEAAAHRIDHDKAEFYPSINLIGSAGFLSFGLDNLAKADASFGGIGPAISLPIFNTERLQGQLRGAHAEYNAAVASYDATLVNALHEVADVVSSCKALDGQLSALQTSVNAVQEAYQLVNDRYRGGLATYLDVLSAEDTLLSARRQLADAQSRSLSLDVALVQSLGGGYGAGNSSTP